MAIGNITAANSVYMLGIPNLYPVPQQLQGYMADAAFDTDSVEPAEVVKGVDGHMSAGFVFTITSQTISLMPDSVSSTIFEDWAAAQEATRSLYTAFATIILPSVSRSYTLTGGVLIGIPKIAGVHKVLQGRPFRIMWDTVVGVPAGA